MTPQSFEDINEVLQREFGAGADELFAEFEQQATAAASLAQVCTESKVLDQCCQLSRHD